MLKNKGGFTLIELVMIIVILGILAAVALPKYQDMANEARQAVVDGNKGAVKSAAIIMFAKNRGVKVPWASIIGGVNYDNVSITIATGDCGADGNIVTITHDGNTAITGSISAATMAEYCSS